MISVILPYRNAATTLREAASSVLADMRAGDELVLVDDGSSDASTEIAGAIAASDARTVRVTSNGIGIAAALTEGLDACRGEWIARMDADDISLGGRLDAERAMLEADPSLGAVATQVEVFGEPGPGMRRYIDWQNEIITGDDHARAIFVESPVCHPSTMIRRATLDAVGGFRDGPFAEDYDLWLRLIAAGWAIAKVPRVLFRYRVHPESTTFRDPRLSFESLRRLRASHLAKRIDRPFAIWGAGPAGRRLARELERHERHSSFFLDIDPRKIGRTARGVPILSVDEGLARAHQHASLVIVAVAAFGARDLVRERLFASGFVEGSDFVCAA